MTNQTPPQAPQHSNSHLTRSSRVKIALILIISFLVLIKLWSCMTAAPVHQTASTSTNTHTPITENSYLEAARPMTTRLEDGACSWTLTGEPPSDITITWGAGNLKVHSIPNSKNDNIVAVFTSENTNLEFAPTLELNEGALTVESASIPMNPLGALFNNISNTTLEIGIPETIAHNLQSLYVEAASGTLDFSGLATESTTVQFASGTLNMNAISSNFFDIEMASGAASIDGQISNELRTDVASGSLSIASTICPGYITINQLSGRTELGLPADSVLETSLDKITGSFNNLLITDYQEYSSADPTGYVNGSIVSGPVAIKPLSEIKNADQSIENAAESTTEEAQETNQSATSTVGPSAEDASDQNQSPQPSAQNASSAPSTDSQSVESCVVTYEVAKGNDLYAIIRSNDETEELMLSGPVFQEVTVEGTWSFSTWVPDAVTITVNGEEVGFNSPTIDDMPTCTVNSELLADSSSR